MDTPTHEYTCSVCTCGKELSTIYYLLTIEQQFKEFVETIGLKAKDTSNMRFIDKNEITNQDSERPEIRSLSFCCLMNLRYGIRAPVSVLKVNRGGIEDSYKYPEGLPGPLSKEKTLTWF